MKFTTDPTGPDTSISPAHVRCWELAVLAVLAVQYIYKCLKQHIYILDRFGPKPDRWDRYESTGDRK